MSPQSDESLFEAARAIDCPEQRSAWLSEHCDPESDQRLRIEALLEADQAGGDLIDEVVPLDPTLIGRDPAGSEFEITEQVIGDYKLLQKIGEGGFGVVYMAEQEEPIRRKVAIKVIKPGMDTAAVVARFEAERQALALMDHPNIATVFGGGTVNERPYFVMELVKGVPVTEYCDANSVSMNERLRLFVTICDAVQHAHRKGIIHRDIKPSNVMVTLHDGRPVIKVIDFGVAKAIHQRLTERTMFTQYGQMIGTPQYMSPEQAEMSGLDIDTRSDIYSLGVLLYELITGSAPLTARQLREAGLAEMQRLIRETVPPKPSQHLSTTGQKLTIIARHRSASPDRLMKFVRGDLDWIIMKALEKDRRRRYETARDFSDDIHRLLNQEAIVARPPSLAYRMSKAIRKHRVATAVLLALVAATITTTFGMWRAIRAEEQNAQRVVELGVEQARLQDANRENRQLAAAAAAHRDKAIANAAEAEKHAAEARKIARQANSLRLATEASQLAASDPGLAISLGVEAAGQAVTRHSFHNTALLDALRNNRELKSIPLRTKGVLLEQEPESEAVRKSLLYAPAVAPFACYPVGSDRLLVCFEASPAGAVCVDLKTGAEVFHMGRMLSRKEFRSLRFDRVAVSRTNDVIATVTHGSYQYTFQDGIKHSYSGRAVRLWSARTGKELRVLRGHTGLVNSLQFTADGTRLLTAAFDGTARIWDVQTGEQITSFQPSVEAISPNPFGGTLPMLFARFGPDETRVISLLGNRLLSGPKAAEPGFEDDPLFDQTRTAVTTQAGGAGGSFLAQTPCRVLLWESESADPVADHAISNAEDTRISMGFVPETDEFVVRVRRLEQDTFSFYSSSTGEPTAPRTPPQRGHDLAHNGVRLHAVNIGHDLVLWRQAEAGGDWVCSHRDPVIPQRTMLLSYPTNSRRLIGTFNNRPLEIRFDKSTLEVVEHSETDREVVLRGHSRDVAAVTRMPDGRVVSIDNASTIKVWNVSQSGGFPERIEHSSARPVPVSWARFIGKGNRVLFAAGEPGNQAPRNSDRFRLKTGIHRSVYCFDRSRPDAVQEFQPADRPKPASTFSDQMLQLLRRNGDVLNGGLVYFDVSPDGRMLVTVHDDYNTVEKRDDEPVANDAYQPVRVWDLQSGELLYSLKGFRNRVEYAQFSPDGTQIATLESSTSLRILLGNSRHGIFNRTSYFGGVDVFDANTGQREFTLVRSKELRETCASIHWIPGSSTLVCIYHVGPSHPMFDTTTGLQTGSMPGIKPHVFAASPDGRRVAIGGPLLTMLNADGTDSTVLEGRQPTSLEFSPDSKTLLATFMDGTAVVYHPGTDRQVTLQGHQRRINVGRFSPDGKWIVTAGNDSTARIWNPETGLEWLKVVVNQSDPEVAVDDAMFSLDSRSILTTTGSTSAHIWPLDPASLVNPRPLTEDERQRFAVDVISSGGGSDEVTDDE